jgi:trans-aconitate methyltransferase
MEAIFRIGNQGGKMIKKTIGALIQNTTGLEPWKVRKLISNGIKYWKFSFNMNSKKYWDEKLSRYEDFWRDENYHHILHFFPPDEEFSLLDVGCALGDGCELIQRRFPKAKITGCDISKVGIEKANRKNRKIEYKILDITTDELSKKYDYITIIETLEHFDDPFPVVEKCLKFANKSLIVSVPYSLGESKGINRNDFSEHRYCFNEKTFEGCKCKTVFVTDYVRATESRCIIYELVP